METTRTIDAQTWNSLRRDSKPGDIVVTLDKYGREEFGIVVEVRRSIGGFYLGEINMLTVRQPTRLGGEPYAIECGLLSANAPVVNYASDASDRIARLERAEALYLANLSQHKVWADRIAKGWTPGWVKAARSTMTAVRA